jgi:hypothetical protein
VNDGTVTSGLPGRPSFSYVFAEGTTLSDFRSFFTFHNPNTTDAAAEVTYSTDAGEVVTRTLVVPAQSRITTQIFSADDAGKGALGLADRGFGAVIQSTNGVSINVERPIYEIHNFEGIGPVNGATDVVGRPGGSALSVAKSVAPATVTSGGQAVSTVTVNVFEADAHQLTVVDSVEVTPTEGTDAAFVPAASTVPAGFTCDGQTGAEVVCTATGDATPGTYTFGLAFTMTNQAGLGRPVATPVAVNDVVVVSALNTDTSSTTGAVTVNPAP